MAPQAVSPNPRGVLTHREVAAFCAQVSLILRAGIPLSEGLAILGEDTDDPAGRAILEDIAWRVDQGQPFFAALAAGGRFPKYVVDMVEIGEAAGRLDQVLDSLADYYDRQEGISQSIKSAVTYPLVMILMMLLTIFVLVVKVLPIFAQVFRQLGSEMTAFSQRLLSLGSLLGVLALVVLVVLALGAAVLLLLRVSRGGRRVLAGFFDRFFLTRGVSSRIASGRFASAMALTLASGLDMDRSLEMADKLVDNPRVSRKIARCQDLLLEGASLSDALTGADIFSGINARMVTMGIRSGAADQVMRRIADRYEEEVNQRIAGILSVLEPTLVAVLSVVVGVILLSVMLPLMGIMSAIG